MFGSKTLNKHSHDCPTSWTRHCCGRYKLLGEIGVKYKTRYTYLQIQSNHILKNERVFNFH